MREVQFKNKEVNHALNIHGKLITFKNGSAQVEDVEAEVIKEMKDPNYKVVEEKPTNPVKPKPKKKPAKKKE